VEVDKIMKKPESWNELPTGLLKEILWDIDRLDYDSFESSMAECIHDILNENISCINRKIIDSYWQELSDESFIGKVREELHWAKHYVAALEALLED
jgi:hypothetical protein